MALFEGTMQKRKAPPTRGGGERTRPEHGEGVGVLKHGRVDRGFLKEAEGNGQEIGRQL